MKAKRSDATEPATQNIGEAKAAAVRYSRGAADPGNPADGQEMSSVERELGELKARADATDKTLARMEEAFNRLGDKLDAGLRENREAFAATQERIADLRIDIAKVPTKTALFGYTSTVAALAVAVIGVFIGILAYLGQLPGQ